MQLDPQDLKSIEIYKILTALVSPRPIALVTTVDRQGRVNAAPFSFFNAFGANPPVLAFAPGDKEPGVPKDTARNIKETGQFVVNLVDDDIAQAMHDTSAPLASGENELLFAGLSSVPSELVKPPRIAESPASFECDSWGTLEIGFNRIVIGVVKYMHIREGLLDPQTFRMLGNEYKPVGRMQGPGVYCHSTDRFNLEITGK